MAKTNNIVIFQDWTEVANGTMTPVADQGFAVIDDSFDNLLQIELIALTSSALTTATEIIIETSGDGTNWTELRSPFSVLLDDNGSTTINDATVTALDETITLTSIVPGFGDIGRRWFIEDGTDANSESVRTVSVSTNTITLASPLIRSHVDGLNVYMNVTEWSLKVPVSVTRLRVLCVNGDATHRVMYTARILKTTSLT
jgi:hypothetical protein